MAEEKKIIIDEDWKEEAQREKETLAKTLEEEKQQQQAPVEQASFALLVSDLATQTLIHLGEMEHPATKQRSTNLPQARFCIDMLAVLEQKTQGNLAAEEAHMLQQLLFGLRMSVVAKNQPAA